MKSEEKRTEEREGKERKGKEKKGKEINRGNTGGEKRAKGMNRRKGVKRSRKGEG